MRPNDLRRERVGVLVVGGGLAAMQAAVSAAEAGASVGVASKRRMGRSGSSAMTSGGYAAAMPDNAHGDDPDVHLADTMAGSGDIADPALVRILCDEGPLRVAELERVGGAFLKDEGRFVLSASGDHSRVRSLGAYRHLGTDFTIPLAEHALRLGVREFPDCMVVELLMDDGEVAGALVIDVVTGDPYVIEADATILATGGCGQLYPVTSNPRDVTGDGFAMAARAGACLRDMEFVQFYPWRCIDPFTKSRVAIQPATFAHGGKLFNSRGERFMAFYEPEHLEATTRDISAIAIFDQMRRGLGVGSGVRLDLSDLSSELMEQTNPKLMRGLKRPGIDYRNYDFIVAPEAHYYMGGIEIDANAVSTVPRLYAVGEVAGGIQGGNRLSNNALPEALVFGRRAGLHAAHVVREGVSPTPASDGIAAGVRTIVDVVERGRQVAEIAPSRAEIQVVGQAALGIIREEAELAAGQRNVEHLIDRLWRSGADSPGQLGEWLEHRSLLETAELGLVAARGRTESRAAHYRSDFPERDDERWRVVTKLRRARNGVIERELAPCPRPHAVAGQE